MDSSLGNNQVTDNIISGLPDAILGHILFFIPTKSAVKTSVLSKRWQHVWTKVPALDFTEMPSSPSSDVFNIYWGELSRERKICFKNFVDRVLCDHDVFCLQHLRVHFGIDDLKCTSWLNAMLLRFQISEIDLKVKWNIRQGQLHGQHVLLPTRIFSCKKLMVLKLSGAFEVDLPVSINLPNLKAIHLFGVTLPGDEFVRNLSVSCPALKKIIIFSCFGIQTLSVDSLTLEILQVVSNVGSIVIKTPNLKSLCLAGTLKQHVVSDLPLLMEGYLYLSFADSGDARLILRRVSRIKTLQLRLFQCLRFVSNYPTFQNLTHLMITADACSLQILSFAPKLKSLIIEKVCSYCGTSSFECDLMPRLLPCLEHVKFSDFEGIRNEMKLLAYFLQVGSALKEMKIITRRLAVSRWEILMLPRFSATCQVEIVHNQ